MTGGRESAGPGLARGVVLPTYGRADLTIVRGEGCRVWDDTGRAYLDFGAGIAVVGLGHRHPGVTAAAHAQLDALWHASNLYWTEPMLRLAGLLSDRMGGAQAFFCNSGAEANEAALKVARKATGRPRILALEGGFHGRTFGALSATGAARQAGGLRRRCSRGSSSPADDIESVGGGRPGDDLALVIVEPILGEGVSSPSRPAFLGAVADLAREVGALLCVDEVQAGLGRTGTLLRLPAARRRARPRHPREGPGQRPPDRGAAGAGREGADDRARRPRLDLRRQPGGLRGRLRRRRGDRRRPPGERGRPRYPTSPAASGTPGRPRGARPWVAPRGRPRPGSRTRRRRLPRARAPRPHRRSRRAPPAAAAGRDGGGGRRGARDPRRGPR